MNDYWTLTNISYQAWRRAIMILQKWPGNPMFHAIACRAQADYVMYSAFEQFEINHGSRRDQ